MCESAHTNALSRFTISPTSSTAERPPDDTDELLTRVADGDRDAFSRFYDLTAPRIHGLVRRLLVDSHQAEEVTQEVFLEIWQTASRFDGSRGKALSWSMVIAHRRSVDRIRASQASRNRDLKIGIRDIQHDYDSVSESVEVSQEFLRAKAAMARLTTFQREAVEAAYFNGLSHTEMAERLGISVATAKTRLRDGLIRLRAEMAA